MPIHAGSQDATPERVVAQEIRTGPGRSGRSGTTEPEGGRYRQGDHEEDDACEVERRPQPEARGDQAADDRAEGGSRVDQGPEGGGHPVEQISRYQGLPETDVGN